MSTSQPHERAAHPAVPVLEPDKQFRGEWPSLTAFAEHELRQAGTYEVRAQWMADKAPAVLRQYVTLDVEHYAADRALELQVSEHKRGVWIFDLNEPTDEGEEEQ